MDIILNKRSQGLLDEMVGGRPGDGIYKMKIEDFIGPGNKKALKDDDDTTQGEEPASRDFSLAKIRTI